MIHIIPTLEDNYTYAVQSGSHVVLIDCGEAAPVLDFLKKNDLRATDILCTHHHGDHIAGLAGLKKYFPDLKIYAPEKDRSRIDLAEFGLTDDQGLKLNGNDFLCIETKGHTQNHLCFYSPTLKAAFTGDTLFSMGCGRLFEGTAQDMYDSLQKLKMLPEETLIYCGHEYTLKNAEFGLTIEPYNTKIRERIMLVKDLKSKNEPTLPVTLRKEKETNVFLRAETPDDIAHLRKARDNF